MDRWAGKVAVVTGASSGIGLEIAKALYREGMIVVGFARRDKKIEIEMENAEGKGKLYARKCDVSKEQDVKETFEWVKENLGNVHVLVNNAGITVPGNITGTGSGMNSFEKVIAVNIMGVLYCSQQAVKIMKLFGEEGHIININSIAGHRLPRVEGVPMNVYPATKYAVTALTQTLEMELIGSKIKTTSISPGLVKTEIHQGNSFITSLFDSKIDAILEPEDIAESVIYVLGTPPRVQVTELTKSFQEFFADFGSLEYPQKCNLQL